LFNTKTYQYDPLDPDNDPSDPLSDQFYSMATELNDDMAHCFAHLPAQVGIPFELDFQRIAAAQERDADLTALKATYPLHCQYVDRMLAPDINVCCYTAQPADPWRIYLPNELLENAVRWYHLALSHLGSTRVNDTMSMHFYNPKLKSTVEDIVTKCETCQRYKLVGRGHGELAPREAALIPWNDIAVDLIGPWTLKVAGRELRFVALTIIDTVTGLTEIVRVNDQSAAQSALMFENTWLSRYPRPSQCQHDQGKEFVGNAFQQMLIRNGIHDNPTSSRNPQANSICERMHQVIGNALRVLSTMNPPEGIVEATQLVDTAIANAMFAHRAAYSSAIQTTPGGLAFGHDMILAVPLIADLQMIRAPTAIDRQASHYCESQTIFL
jgi:hypothetical protein